MDIAVLKGKAKFLWLAPLIFVTALVFSLNWHYPMWMDEYVFYRLGEQFPDYSTTSDWFFVDRPEILNPSIDWEESGFDRDEALHEVYDTQIFLHNPAPVIIMWPIINGLDWVADHTALPHIEEQKGTNPYPSHDPKVLEGQQAEWITIILRMFPLTLFFIALLLVFRLAWMRVGLSACLYILPVAISVVALSGANLLYWDVFMIFFFVLTLYLMETKPDSKWWWLTACLMVNTKMFIGLIFLIPLMIKNWKVVFAGFSLLPFWLVVTWVTGDFWYPFTHLLQHGWIHNYMYHLIQWEAIINVEVLFFAVMTLPILYYYKKYPVYATFYLITMIYAWGTGLGITHMSNIIYAGALVWPLVAYEWGLMDWVLRRLKIKEVKIGEGITYHTRSKRA